MIRSIAFLVIGALLGGAAVLAVEAPKRIAADRWPFGSGGGAASVEASLAREQAASSSARRDREIDELVARAAAEDAAGAVGLARAQGLDSRFVEAAYRYWAAEDPVAALTALTELGSAAERRAVALALLDVLGDDVASAARIAAALPAAERAAFESARLARLAERDPESAFYELTALTGAAQLAGAERVARAWAAVDPLRALAQASLLPEDVQARFRSEIYSEWARLDPAAVLEHIETDRPSLLDMVGALQHLAMGDPETLLAAADRLPAEQRSGVTMLALVELMERTPDAAIARLAAMPPGAGRDTLVSMVAMAYAPRDPERALALVDELAPSSPNAKMTIAAGLAQTDPARALDLLDKSANGQEAMLLQGLIVQMAAQDSAQAAKLAATLAERGRAKELTMLSNLFSNWLQSAPDRALEWLAERTDLQPGMLGLAAASVASRDPAVAASYVERLPDRYRAAWIVQMAGPYARSDLDAALTWIGRFHGQQVFDDAYSQMVLQAASSDPAAARGLLDRYPLDPETRRRLEQQIDAPAAR